MSTNTRICRVLSGRRLSTSSATLRSGSEGVLARSPKRAYVLCDQLVPGARIELARPFGPGILSPAERNGTERLETRNARFYGRFLVSAVHELSASSVAASARC